MFSSIGNIVGGLLGGGAEFSSEAVTDQGYVEASEKASAAMEMVATINTAAATYIAIRQLSLAEKYYDLAKEARDYWKGTFRPMEVKAVQEIDATPLYTPQYDVTAGRFVAQARQQFRKIYDEVGVHARRYCTGMTAALMKDAAVAQATALSDTTNLAYRYEDGRKQAFDELRWARRHQMLSLGRDMLTVSKSYSDSATNMYGNLRDWTMGNANNARMTMRYDERMSNSVFAQSSGQVPTAMTATSGPKFTSILPGGSVAVSGVGTDYANNSTQHFLNTDGTFTPWSQVGNTSSAGDNLFAPGAPMGAVSFGGS